MRMLSPLVWRVLDWFDYQIWDARRRMADAVYGPEPGTEVDRARSSQQRPYLRRRARNTVQVSAKT